MILNDFENVIKKGCYDKTVVEFCREVGIKRDTFKRHYPECVLRNCTSDALQIFEQKIDLIKLDDGVSMKVSMYSNLYTIFLFICENRKIFLNISKKDSDAFIKRIYEKLIFPRIKKALKEDKVKNVESYHDEFLEDFLLYLNRLLYIDDYVKVEKQAQEEKLSEEGEEEEEEEPQIYIYKKKIDIAKTYVTEEKIAPEQSEKVKDWAQVFAISVKSVKNRLVNKTNNQ